MNKLIAPIVVLLLFASTVGAFLAAFHAGYASADTGPGSGPAVTKPADSIHDPVSEPSAAWDDVKAAKKVGWGVAALAVLVLAARVLGRLGGWFSFLARGKSALVIGAVGALAVAGYNAVMLGGSWFAAALAAVVAGAAYWDSHATPPPPVLKVA